MQTEETWSNELRAAGSGNFIGLASARISPFIFLLSLLGLLGLGLTMVYSSTVADKGEALFWNQALWIGLGWLMAFALALIPTPRLAKFSFWGLLSIGILLAYLALAFIAYRLDRQWLDYFPLVVEVKGAVRWLRFVPGGRSIQLQPSEFAKLMLIIALAAYYGSLGREKIRELKAGFLIPGLASGLILCLILAGKDLSTTVITGCTVFAIMLFAGVRFRYLFFLVFFGLLLCSAAIFFSPERVSRITSYQEPELYQQNDSYQLWRSQLGMGTGGLWGRGFGTGILKTFLPEAHTDFIVAVIGEELGFVGVMLVLLLYLTLTGSIVFIAWQCRDRFSLLLCLGIAVLIYLQAMVNIGVVSGWCPTTGVTAPFLSYGGSSMMSLLMGAGLILNVCRRNLCAIWDEALNSHCHLTSFGRLARLQNSKPQKPKRRQSSFKT